jgi:vitamin B12 transporter
MRSPLPGRSTPFFEGIPVRCSVSRAAFAAVLLASPQSALAAADDTTSDEQVVVTATRAGGGVPRDQLGSSVTVIQPIDLELRQTRVVSDVLRDVPGVAVSRLGTVGGTTDIRIRGAEGNHTMVLIDGMEVSDPFTGAFDFATLIADEVARIEVLRGQQSALYGAEAIGGVINYISLSGAEAPGVSGRAEGGSFGSYGGAARVAGVDGGFDYAINGAYQSSDGVPTSRFGTRDIGAENAAISGRLSYQVTPEFSLRALGRYSWTQGDVNDQDFDFTSPTFGYVIDSDDTYDLDAFYGLVGADLSLMDGAWTHALTLQGVDTQRDNFSGGALDSGTDGGRVKASYVTAWHFGDDAVRHTLTGAVDWERESFRNRGPFLTDEQSLNRHIENTGLVAQYDVLIGKSAGFGAAIRYDDNDMFDDATTWRVHGSYAFGFGLRVHAAGGSGVQNPGIFELFGFDPGTFIGNPDLKPEESTGWEAGLEQSFLDGALRIDATYFNATLKDEIYTDFSGYPISIARNRLTDSEQQGVELSVEALLDDAWRVFVAYTWLDAEENGAEEVRRPEHSGSFNLSYVDPDGAYSATLTVRYNGRTLDNNFTFSGPALVELDEYTLVNLGGDVRLTGQIRAYARVENLFDEAYEDVYTYATAGRAAYVGLKAGF